MGHSFTSFRDKHIRSKDYKIETWLLLVVREIDALPEKAKWLVEARNNWEGQGKHGVNGCIDPNLDAYLVTESKIAIFKELVEKVHSNLNEFGPMIPKEYLNQLHGLESPNDIREDNEAELYLSFGSKLLSLLDGSQSDECIDA